MVSKDTTTKKAVKKEEPKKLIEVFEEAPVTEVQSIPKRHYVQFWNKVRPSDSR